MKRTLSRRTFLQSSLTASASLAGLVACGGGSSGATIPISSGGGTGGGGNAGAFTNPILIVINVDGGWDWLNVLPPDSGTNLTAYQTRRSTLKITPATTLGSGVGLNGDFIGLDVLHAQGRVAWVTGLSMPTPNLSHFTAGDLWAQGGTTGSNPTTLNGTGWLGRFGDQTFDAANAIQGITTVSSVHRMIAGAQRSFIPITSTNGFRYPGSLRNTTLQTPYSTDTTLLQSAYNLAASSVSSDSVSRAAYELVAKSQKSFYDATQSISSLTSRTPSVPYPGDSNYINTNGAALSGSLSSQFKLIASMIAANLPIQVYYCRLGGWDTHSNQLTTMKNLLSTLGGSIKSFYDDLGTITTSTGLAQNRVMMMTWSEFGRRVTENSGGTDHGTNSLSLCIGNSIKGGLYGAYPNLASLDNNGNMLYSSGSDFRSMYATVLDRWLGQATTSTNTLLGSNYARMNFL